MRTSKNGQEERDAKNNHGSCWVLQAAEFARFTGNAEVMTWCRDRFKSTLVPDQVAPDGSLPLELARTKPYSYCLFDLDVLSTICQTLSTEKDNLWTFTTPDGRGMRKVVAFMYPFIKDKNAWPYKHDVEHLGRLPHRQPSLLFAGVAYTQNDYIALWKTLNPDPDVPEVIRNFPVRQPLLWMAKPEVAHEALVFRLGQPMHLRTRQKKAADAVDITGRWFELAGLPIDRLNRTQPPISVDVAKHSLPRLFHDRQIGLAIENLLVDPIRDPKGEERRT